MKELWLSVLLYVALLIASVICFLVYLEVRDLGSTSLSLMWFLLSAGFFGAFLAFLTSDIKNKNE